MTNEEAIKHLEEWKECISSAYRRQVIDMAIKALEDIERWRTWSHTYDNLISRVDAIDALLVWEEKSIWNEECLKHRGEPYWEAPSDVIEHLPSADRPTGMLISEELENMICNEICYYKEVTVDADSLNDLCEGCLIKKMKYDRPTGEWIKSDILPHGYFCSNCDAPVMTDDISEMLHCPNCGAEMVGESNG